MRLVLDACVLYPPTLRRLLLAHAEEGGFEPVWSARILDEWARAAERNHGPEGAGEARAAAAKAEARFPAARVEGWEPLEDPAGLPDPADAHVIAAARVAGADAITTLDLRHFPLRVLAAHGLARVAPDEFLRLELRPEGAIRATLDALAAETSAATLRRTLKRGGLPRLAKAWSETGGLEA